MKAFSFKLYSKKVIAILWLLPFFVFARSVSAQDLQADNMLLFQNPNGGWPKHWNAKTFKYDITYSDDVKAEIKKSRNDIYSTIDNNATTKEIKYLLTAYIKTQNKEYLKSVEKSLNYLLNAQYANGGWPQFYPDDKGYRKYITFNDNAMTNVMQTLKLIYTKPEYTALFSEKLINKLKKANDKAVACILKCQIKVDGVLTAWCAQHDNVTLEARPARSFELTSISGGESVAIVEYLMQIENPSPEVINAVKSAVNWFEKVKIEGYRYDVIRDTTISSGYKRTLVADSSAKALWARFYEIGTNRPFFSDRDGIKKYNLSEIDQERSMGYSWYVSGADKLLNNLYPKWIKKIEG
ncbi:pectate lyase [Polluticaenibacter yanchengensis]|uniref:Pectate lyase n=1 Tax=Polluticaenibacter yanchengensis TaxID=3014562 RepID=A0ABT4UES2_9BACT|nr:pectate lyase [Chitinophagaceae bacterium LY-5]